MPGGWLSATQVAKVLKVTPSRVFQLARGGELPPPRREEGARFWHSADVDAVAQLRAGHVLSRRSEGLQRPEMTLDRVFDGLVVDNSSRARSGAELHVRVWAGLAAEGRRTVVLIAPVSWHRPWEELVEAAAAAALTTPAHDAVWFVHRPARRPEDESLMNLVLAWDQDADTAGGESANGTSSTIMFHNQVSVSMADLTRVVGEVVETFHSEGYTRDTIRRWQATGLPIEVEYDNIGFRRNMTTIEAMRSPLLPASRRADAHSVAALIAGQLRENLDLVHRLGFSDGTDDPSRKWATRLVAPIPTSGDEYLLAQYPGPIVAPNPPTSEPATTWEAPPSSLTPPEQREYRGWIALRARIQDWLETVTADDLTEALEDAEAAVRWELRLANQHAKNYRAVLPPRRYEIRMHDVDGPNAGIYLAGLIRIAQDDDLDGDGRGEGSAPGRRQMRLLEQLERYARSDAIDVDRSWLGVDPAGHLVAFAPAVPSRRRSRSKVGTKGAGQQPWAGRMVLEWPLRPPQQAIPDDAVVVADGGRGHLPVFLHWPSGEMTPWPGGTSTGSSWNFGPRAAGQSLAHDLTEVLAAADMTSAEEGTRKTVEYLLEAGGADQLAVKVGELRDARQANAGPDTPR